MTIPPLTCDKAIAIGIKHWQKKPCLLACAG